MAQHDINTFNRLSTELVELDRVLQIRRNQLVSFYDNAVILTLTEQKEVNRHAMAVIKRRTILSDKLKELKFQVIAEMKQGEEKVVQEFLANFVRSLKIVTKKHPVWMSILTNGVVCIQSVRSDRHPNDWCYGDCGGLSMADPEGNVLENFQLPPTRTISFTTAFLADEIAKISGDILATCGTSLIFRRY
ncbi:MAG: hypothetical protein Edafosvirus2_63 [Edafosvirus sp.]|uniref:Uncharacterized protein n=1 Tax=Edafosvirus sp. TaxID=2487765 RepID=A0A3G4ZU88_9VIRU|nr:MAG: hypothetical protein Edafosvirus2_63 [Edafosvirus sp.]